MGRLAIAFASARAAGLGLLLGSALAHAAPAAVPLHVLATTTDLAALASAVAGEAASVESIIPPGVDPEGFEARPRDLDRLRRADLLIRVGLGYDYWLDALVSRNGQPRFARGGNAVVDASAGIALLEVSGQSVVNEGGHAHGVANPHYWLDPQNAALITAAIVEALIRLSPEQRDRFVGNRERFLADLQVRQARWIRTLAPFAGARLIAQHNSWPYFARRFRLDVILFIEPKPGIAPSPARLGLLIAEGRSKNIRAVLREPHQPEDSSRYIAQKLKVPLLQLALSVGGVPAASNYIGLLEYDVGTIAAALSTASR